MQMITQHTRRHNRTALALALGLFLLAGCGGGQDQSARQEVGTTHVATSCAMVASDQGLAGFLALADRVDGGEAVTLEEFTALAEEPVWTLWRRSFEPKNVPALPIGRTIFISLRGKEALPEQLRNKTLRADLLYGFEIAHDYREQICSFVDAAIADEVGCGIGDRLAGWVPADALPDTLYIDFVVGYPEIRYYEGHLMVDAGMAWAAGSQQLERFLSSTVYKGIAAIDGEDPGKIDGGDVVLECLRVVRNEAVPAYLDDMPELAFDPRHKRLRNAAPIPEEFCSQATRTLVSLDRELALVRARPAPTQDNWLSLYRLFVGAQSWQATGWFTARVIADNLGEERLQEASRTVPGYWAAYQEACTHLPETPTADRGSIEWHLQSAPSFSDDNAQWIDAGLRRLFP